MAVSLDELLRAELPAVVDDVVARHAIERAEARRLVVEVKRLLWLLSRAPADEAEGPGAPGRIAALLSRPLAVLAAVGERLVVRSRDYDHLCRWAFDRPMPWPSAAPCTPPPGVEEIRETMEWIYEELGEEVFARWFHELADRYRPEDLEGLRLLPTRKTFEFLDPGAVIDPAGSGTPSRFDVRCAVRGTEAEPARVIVALRQPRVAVVQGALTPAECEYLIGRARGRTQASLVRNDDADRSRTSHSWAPGPDDAVAEEIRRRFARIVGMPVDRGEPLRVHAYREGQRFMPHYDNASSELREQQGIGGVRLVSTVAYLDEVDDGGDTWFPYLGLSVMPVPGTLLVFHNFRADGHEDPRKKHAGRPVRAGEKWIATQWYWSVRFSSVTARGR